MREVLRRLLQKAKRPLTGPELTAQVQATGYKSRSAQMQNVLGAMLSKMDGIEHSRGQGYCLQGKK